jgi:hypothetical protein
MNLPGSLNVIVLLTDGRPSGFTGSFATKSPCNGGSAINGVLQSYVTLGGSYPFWPPPTSGADVFGLLATQLTGSYPWTSPDSTETSHPATHSGTCAYDSDQTTVGSDLASGNFPSSVGPVDRVGATYNTSYPYYTTAGTGISTQKGVPITNHGYYDNPGTSASNPQSVRFAAFNVADNMATLIRQDTVLKPMLFVIGLSYTDTLTEPLDPDFLAKLANDPNYVTVGSDATYTYGPVAAGQSVYNNTQTPGMYCNSTPATLNTCFAKVTSQLLRLMQ